MVLRFVATIIGCDYDDLVRRSKARDACNVRRTLVGLGGVIALLLGTILFGLYQRSDVRNYRLTTELRTTELRNQTLLTEKAKTAEKTNLALAHYGCGIEAETAGDLPAAKLHFAKSFAIYETPEGRKKLADTWFTARRLWDVDLPPARLPPEPGSRGTGRVRAIRFSRDGTTLYVGTAEGRVWSLAAATGERRGALRVGIPVRRIASHPLDRRLAVGGEDGTVLVLWPETGKVKLRSQFPGPIAALAFNDDGRALGVGLESGGLRVIDADTGESWFRSPPGLHETIVSTVSFAPEGGETIWGMGRWVYTADIASGHMSLVTPQNDLIEATAWSRGDDPLLAWAGLDGPIQILRRHEQRRRGAGRNSRGPEAGEADDPGTPRPSRRRDLDPS